MFRRLNKYLLPHLPLFGAGLFFVFLSNLFSLYPARLISRSMDLLIDTLNFYPFVHGTFMRPHFVSDTLWFVGVFAGAIILMALIKGGFMFLMRQTLIIMSRKIEYEMKNQIFAHYQAMDQAFFKRHATGDLMTRISEDVSKVRMYVGPAIMYTANMVIMFVLVVSMMLWVSPRLTAVVLLPMPVLSVLIYFVNKSILIKSDRVQNLLSGLTSFVQESFSGIRLIKAFNKESIFRRAFEARSMEYRAAGLALARVDAALFPTILFLIGTSTLLALWYGAVEVASGRITPGVIAEFIVYVNMLTWPVASLGWVTSIIQQAMASFRRICAFLDTEPAITPGGAMPPSVVETLEFDNVYFTFPDTGIQALRCVSFIVRRGDFFCITGRTGAGKSAIVQLIMRFYDPDSGVIRLNGVDIRTLDVREYRKLISYVPQEAFLFSDTVAANIGCGASEAPSLSEVSEAAEKAAVLDTIRQMPQGFETQVGEKGVKISGGQKQRLSLARAFLKKPQVYLVDDGLSALDYETEKKIRDQLVQAEASMVIMTGHRASAFPENARVLVLHHGQVVAEGTREILLQKEGYFSTDSIEKNQ